jgi:hypothetical protein
MLFMLRQAQPAGASFYLSAPPGRPEPFVFAQDRLRVSGVEGLRTGLSQGGRMLQ